MNAAKPFALTLCAGFLSACSPSLPNLQPAEKAVWLEQNWTESERKWFHHAPQGTATFPIPYEWFMALEQPDIEIFGDPGLLSDNAYLLRFGFIKSEAGGDNVAGLPVGFAVDRKFKDPVTGKPMNAIGLTCAACHTGHLNYKGTEIRIDGGPAVANVPRLFEVLVYSMVYTKKVPFRFDRFAHRVLGADYSAEKKEKLEAEFGEALKYLLHAAALDKKVAANSVEEGFARTDALTRIGNQVFGLSFKDENYHAVDAPVAFPHIWGAPWFDWVQYDGSIMQPMVRNAGEALGVAAAINLNGPKSNRFDSTVKVDTLYEIEKSLAGEKPPTDGKQFGGLWAPKWPEAILGPIDKVKAEQGKALYGQYCQQCHLPAPNTAEFWDDRYWSAPNAAGERYLRLLEVPITKIGTDPMQAKALADRKVNIEGMGLDTTVYVLNKNNGHCEPAQVKDGAAVPYGAALGAVVQEAARYYYDQNKIAPDDRERMNGHRPNCLDPSMQYKARPLDGIWATPPYLHNGSVPNLYALLSPASERPASFYLGNPEFDPVHVGYETGAFDNGFRLDTSVKGNSNRGHEFDEGSAQGVIGPRLSPEQRAALVEYLKTL